MSPGTTNAKSTGVIAGKRGSNDDASSGTMINRGSILATNPDGMAINRLGGVRAAPGANIELISLHAVAHGGFFNGKTFRSAGQVAGDVMTDSGRSDGCRGSFVHTPGDGSRLAEQGCRGFVDIAPYRAVPGDGLAPDMATARVGRDSAPLHPTSCSSEPG